MDTIHHGKIEDPYNSSSNTELNVRDVDIGYLLVEEINSSEKTQEDTEPVKCSTSRKVINGNIETDLRLAHFEDNRLDEMMTPSNILCSTNLNAYFPDKSIFRTEVLPEAISSPSDIETLPIPVFNKDSTTGESVTQTSENRSIPNSLFTILHSSQLENKPDKRYKGDFRPQSTATSNNLDIYFPVDSIFRIGKQKRVNKQTSIDIKKTCGHKNTLETEVEVNVDQISKESVYDQSHIGKNSQPFAGNALHSNNRVIGNEDSISVASTLPRFIVTTSGSDQDNEVWLSEKCISNYTAQKQREHNCYNNTHHRSQDRLDKHDVKDSKPNEKHLNVNGIPRANSDDNILVQNVKERNNLHIVENTHLKSSSCGNISSRSSNIKNILNRRPCVKFIKSLYKKIIDGRECTYSFVKTLTLRCICNDEIKCTCNSVCAIACTESGGVWLSYKDSKYVALTDLQGNLNKIINVGALVDYLVTAENGDVYLSCSRAQIIKVIKVGDPDVVGVFAGFYTSQWYPRGLAINPSDGFLVVCMATSVDEHITNTYTDNCLMKYDTGCQGNEGFLLTNEKCFGYPLRVSASKDNHVVVWDYGFQCITILNNTGLVIAKFNEINEVKISPRIAIGFDKDDNMLVLQERQPTVTVFKLDGSPLSRKEVRIPALQNCSVSCMCLGVNGHVFVGGFDGIEIFKRQ